MTRPTAAVPPPRDQPEVADTGPTHRRPGRPSTPHHGRSRSSWASLARRSSPPASICGTTTMFSAASAVASGGSCRAPGHHREPFDHRRPEVELSGVGRVAKIRPSHRWWITGHDCRCRRRIVRHGAVPAVPPRVVVEVHVDQLVDRELLERPSPSPSRSCRSGRQHLDERIGDRGRVVRIDQQPRDAVLDHFGTADAGQQRLARGQHLDPGPGSASMWPGARRPRPRR
jgi:hypothetical protein